MGFNKNAPKTVNFKRPEVDHETGINIPVEIVDIDLAAPRFNKDDPHAFDVCVKVRAMDGGNECDWWTSEYSGNYGTGNNSNRTRAEMTTESLEKIGLEGGDLTKLVKLIGMKTTAWIRASKDGRYQNVAGLGSGGAKEPESLGMDEIKRRIQAIKSGSTSQPTTQTQSASTVENPLADFSWDNF